MADLESLTGEETTSLPPQETEKEAPKVEASATALSTDDVPAVTAPALTTTQDTPPAKEQEQQVPIHHLFEARQKFRAAEQDNKELKDRLAKLEKQVEPPGPQYEEDPDGYIKSLEQRISKTDEDLETARTEVTQTFNEQRIQNEISQDQQQFITQQSDYAGALAHNRQIMANNMALQGTPPDEIQAKIYESEMTMAKQIMAQGGSPAKYVYEVARNSGYEPPKVEEKQQQTAPEAVAPASIKIENIKKGQKASKIAGGSDAATEAPKQQGDEFDQAFAEAFAHLKRP